MQYFVIRAIDNAHSSFPNFRHYLIMAQHLTDHSQTPFWDTHARLGIATPSTAREFLCPSYSPSLRKRNHITKQPPGCRRYEKRHTRAERRYHKRYPLLQFLELSHASCVNSKYPLNYDNSALVCVRACCSYASCRPGSG